MPHGNGKAGDKQYKSYQKQYCTDNHILFQLTQTDLQLLEIIIARRPKNLYFYVKCESDIVTAEDANWMNLFINTDGDYETGWYGYDIAINRDGAKAAAGKVTQTIMDRRAENG